MSKKIIKRKLKQNVNLSVQEFRDVASPLVITDEAIYTLVEHLFGHTESYHTLDYSQRIDNEEDSAAIPMLYRHLIAARLDICQTSRKTSGNQYEANST